MHHSPDTEQCFREALRVLKSGGEARIMVYHHPSLTGLMLWLRYGACVGSRSGRLCMNTWRVLGPQTYTKAEIPSAMAGLENVVIRQVFESPGDLLLSAFSPISIASVPVGLETISAIPGENILVAAGDYSC